MFHVEKFKSISLGPFSAALLCFSSLAACAQTNNSLTDQWPTYGGDPGGQRYSRAAQINRTNVSQLAVAWTFHTGLDADPTHAGSFEATPILFRNALYLSSPTDRVYSVDPVTGRQHWEYDPQLDWNRSLGIITSRGVASWSSSSSTPEQTIAGHDLPCADRIFLGTLDARLIALDANTGKPCADFGNEGTVDLSQNVDYRKGDDYSVTSPPTVVGDVVIVGSGIEDNLRVDVELGDVRGFDARSGKQLWKWEPIPWARKQEIRTGAANTWGVIAADRENHLVFLPTSSSSPDYYGGMRPGDNRDADSIVALDSRTGKKVWSFQVVHHDIWDYDIAAEPLLFTFRSSIPAVAVITKMGLPFVFNRLTGQPLYAISERPVPQSHVPGEVTSATQPFADLPPLSPIVMDLNGPLGTNPQDDAACRKLIAGFHYEGIYSPPELDRETVLFPSNVGGVNWGSAAFDPASGILYANTNRIPYIVKLYRRSWLVGPHPLLARNQHERTIVHGVSEAFMVIVLIVSLIRGKVPWVWTTIALLGLAVAFLGTSQTLHARLLSRFFAVDSTSLAQHFGREIGWNNETPYALERAPLVSPEQDKLPCGPTPWGAVSALNLNTGKSAWQTPLGTMVPGMHTGTWSVGGPIVTAGGLVFTAASQQPLLRAFNSTTGEELLAAPIPVPAQATPMTYIVNGKQYLLISAGGHSTFGTKTSDQLIAFSIPDHRKQVTP